MNAKGLFHRLVLDAVLALGFFAVWMVVGVVVLESETVIAAKNFGGDQLSIRADGTALIAHYEENGVVHYRDLRGTPVAIPEDDSTRWLNETRLPPSLPWREEDHQWEKRACFFGDGRTPATVWYFIADGRPDGIAYFVGYDSYSKAKIGYLGVAGFRAETPPPEDQFPFAGSTSGERTRVFSPGEDNRVRVVVGSSLTPCIVYVLGLDQKVYEADLRKRTVRVAVHNRGLRSLFYIAEPSKDPAQRTWRLAGRTDEAILVFDMHGNEQQRYPIPAELRERPITFGETSAGEAVMYLSSERTLMDTEAVYRLFWVRPDGRSRAAEVTLPHDSGLRSLRYFAAALAPSPLALEVTGVVRSRDLQEEGLTPTLFAAIGRTWREFWPALAIAQMIALSLAVLCYRRQVRYGTRRVERIVWPLFVLVLGLPGWIGYRFGRSWPALETCAECGAVVPRDRASCIRCEVDFARPALQGTEVFA